MTTISNKTKVICLVPDLGIGGTQKVILDICSSANLEKYDISIYCLNNNLELLSTYQLSTAIKIKTYSYEYSNDYSLAEYFKHYFFKNIVGKKAKQIIEDIIKEKPDILHLHIHTKELAIGILIEQKINCKLIYTQHLLRLTPKSFSLDILAIIFRIAFHKYNIIAISKGIYNEIINYKLLGKNKQLVLIENKLNLNLYQPKQKQKKEYITVVYVARIGYPKAHAELIHAWSMLDKKYKKKLLLIGPDSMDNRMQQLAKELNTDNSITFMGAQYKIADILNECDFAVFPSFKEGLPIALLEKMAMKLPVIVSDIPELTSIVKHNYNGLVFKCGNADDLAAKITLLLENAELRLQLGNKARETVIEKFGSTNIALANEIFYEKIMKSNG